MANIVGIEIEEREKYVVTPQEEKPVFGADFSCKNCGATFENQFKRGVDLCSDIVHSYYINPNDATYNYIRCGNCNSNKISIINRYPIKNV